MRICSSLRIEDATVAMEGILMEAADVASKSDDWKKTAANIITEHPASTSAVWIYFGSAHIACIEDRPGGQCVGKIVEAA